MLAQDIAEEVGAAWRASNQPEPPGVRLVDICKALPRFAERSPTTQEAAAVAQVLREVVGAKTRRTAQCRYFYVDPVA